MSTTAETRLRSFHGILVLETKNGFQDKAVSGGLDLFLQRLLQDRTDNPGLLALVETGMLNVAYRDLSVTRRERWVCETQRLLAEGVPAQSGTRRPRVAKPKSEVPMPSVSLDAPVDALRSVTRPNADKLKRLGVTTVRSLVYLFPHRHLDYSRLRTVDHLRPGEEQTAVVSLWEAHELRLGPRGRLRATEAIVGDATGNIRVIWFRQPYLAQTFQRALLRASPGTGVMLMLSGKVTAFGGKQQMESPDWEVLEDQEMTDLVHTGRLVPVYPATEGLKAQRTLRRMVREALDLVFGRPGSPTSAMLDDPVPAAVVKSHGLMPLEQAIAQTHYPDTLEAKEHARQRLAFDELLVLQLAMASRRAQEPVEAGIPLPAKAEVLRGFVKSLPFQLTEGQRTAIRQVLADVKDGLHPMNRLLQGDVGSGKTVVALAVLLTAVSNGYQGVLMAPTEILAEQHYLSVRQLLSGLAQPAYHTDWFSFYVDGHPSPVSVGLLTGSTKAAPRRELTQRAAEGTLDILIGTHAVIQDQVELSRVAVGVVDEQHRFGVMQRARLRGKGRQPHLMAMSATPIPRTLAATLYGNMEVSTMPELPSGRQPVVTRFISPARRARAEQFVVEQVGKGRQAFVVCPFIDESESVQTKAATEEFDRLQRTSMAGVRLGLLHGRLPLKDKQEAMERFRSGEVDVLVATPMVEVGIDVPNASVMLIEGADRFGLAQLHQLRGRVGRGAHKSYCLLLAESPSEDAQRRLETLVKSNDGFEIAEADLQFRGPGDFFGTRQSGLPSLRMARLSDGELLASTRDEARRMVAKDARVLEKGPLAAAVRRYTEQVVNEVG